MCRTILLTLALFVLAVAAVAAAPAPASPQGGCAPSLDILTPGAQAVCKPAAPATAPQPEFMSKPPRFSGFCLGNCTRIPDCNTDADCGGALCLHVINC